MVAKPGKLEVSWRKKKKKVEGGGKEGSSGWKELGRRGDDVSNPTTSFPENAV